MTADQTTVLVTGGNRGIGLEIARQLLVRGAQVILTARSEERAEKALAYLKHEKLTPVFHSLDVTKPASISQLNDFVEGTVKHLDVLINNAGVIAEQDGSAFEVPIDAIRATLETNTLAPLRLAQVFAPLLRQRSRGRIINVSSGMAALSDMGGGYAAYRISKTALNAITAILSAELRGSVAVNSMCPGWVRTDMGGPSANRDVAEGADTAVWLAMDAPQRLTGKFFRDRKVIPW